MSLVTIVATEDFVSVITDGRGMKNGNVSSEHIPKVKQYGSNFIAFAGVHEVVSVMLSLLEDGGYTEIQNTDNLSYVVNQLVEAEGTKKFDVMMAVGGISSNGVIKVSTMHTTGQGNQTYTPKAGEINFVVFGNNDKISSSEVLKSELIKFNELTPQFAAVAQENTIKTVSKIDNTVNTNIYKVLIKR